MGLTKLVMKMNEVIFNFNFREKIILINVKKVTEKN